MGHQDVWMSVGLLVTASLTAGNAAFVGGTKPALETLIPDYMYTYVLVLFWTELFSAILQLACAFFLGLRGLQALRDANALSLPVLNVAPPVTTAICASVSPAGKWRVPWNRLPLFTTQQQLPLDVSMERMHLPTGGAFT
jgi:hypothetical protein